MRSDFKYEWLDDSVDRIAEPGEYIIDTETEAEIDEHGNLVVTYKMCNARKKDK